MQAKRQKESASRPSVGKAYFTESEVAERLCVSQKWLQKMRLCGGGIPFLKVGSNVRYAIEDVLDFEAQARRSSTSDPGPAC
jgi:hypothetical protein